MRLSCVFVRRPLPAFSSRDLRRSAAEERDRGLAQPGISTADPYHRKARADREARARLGLPTSPRWVTLSGGGRQTDACWRVAHILCTGTAICCCCGTAPRAASKASSPPRAPMS